MKSISTLKNLKGTRVLLLADFSVPIENGKVVDPFRIQKTLPTIKYLVSKGARLVIISKIGDDGSETLLPVAKYLSRVLKTKVQFSPEIFGATTNTYIEKLKSGEVLLLENIRRDAGEKKNQQVFAKKLAAFGEIYVNDAFSVSHRPYASVTSVPKYLPSYAGLQLELEMKHLSVAFKPKHPFLFILGGAKFSTKLPLIKKYLGSADTLFIGGALANTFIAAKGFEIGKSLTDKDAVGIKLLLKNKKIQIPSDVFVTEDIADKKYAGSVKKIGDILKKDYIVDIGPDTMQTLIEKITTAKFVLWNGPLGKSGYDAGTEMILEALSFATKNGATSIIGGGDTAEIISRKKMEGNFTFVSTGGGATLDYLAKGTLPGIKALK